MGCDLDGFNPWSNPEAFGLVSCPGCTRPADGRVKRNDYDASGLCEMCVKCADEQVAAETA